MTTRRVVVVFPIGPVGSALAPFYSLSFVGHVVLVIGLILGPSLRSRSRPFQDAMVVELAAGLPGPRSAPAGEIRPPGPATAQLPPEGVRAEAKPVVAPDLSKKKREDAAKKKEDAKPTAEPEQPTSPVSRTPLGPPQAPGGPAGPPGSPVPPGGGQGGTGITSLDVGDVEFAWYRASVTAALRSRWVRPVIDDADATLVASVAFEVRRDGSVENVRIETSSGVAVMDRSVLRAVIEASPLPPLPPTWREPLLEARFEFRWHPEGAE